MRKRKQKLSEKELEVRRRRRDSLFQLIRYILRYKWRLLAVIVAVITANLLALLIPAFYRADSRCFERRNGKGECGFRLPLGRELWESRG